MPFSRAAGRVTLAGILALISCAALSAQTPPAQDPTAPALLPLMQASPILNAIDVNHDAKIDATELANAPARLKTLDKNNDGKLTRDEAGLPPGFGRPAGPGRGGRGEGDRGGDRGRGGDAGRAGDAG